MMISVTIKPELEAELVARAHSAGQPLETFVNNLLEHAVASIATQGQPALSASEKARSFLAWSDSFPPNLPQLSLEDLSRERIYQRD
jgi:hypothetical protein